MGGGRDVDDSPLPQAYGFDESTVAFEGLGNRILDNPKSNSIELGQGEIEICDRWDKTKRYTDLTIDFIKRNKDRPFYVHLFPNDVHDRHVPIPGTEEKWKTVTDNPFEHTFFSVLEQMDEQLGRVIDAVDELGLAEETLIIFTSDNGPTDWAKYYSDGGSPPGFTGPFHGRKWSLYEGGIRMPFIARWKGRIPAGVTDETSIMSGIDLSPTFCQLAGVKAEGLDGVDCGEVLLGKTRTYPKPLFWQYGRPYARLMPGKLAFHSPSYAVRDGDYKFLVNPDGTDAQLFDIASDQGETANLLAEKPDLASGLQQKIGDWSQEVGVEFDASAKLEAPKPKAGVVMFNKIVPF
ncbi:MAG: sulfatase-like hydrolase/transferase, partial [Verrucomicrobiota bacterium]